MSGRLQTKISFYFETEYTVGVRSIVCEKDGSSDTHTHTHDLNENDAIVSMGKISKIAGQNR